MFDHSAGLGMIATQRTRDLARSGLADAPVRDHLAEVPDRPVRRRVAVALHWLADRLDPTPTLPHPALH
jgi:hypothetical protein